VTRANRSDAPTSQTSALPVARARTARSPAPAGHCASCLSVLGGHKRVYECAKVARAVRAADERTALPVSPSDEVMWGRAPLAWSLAEAWCPAARHHAWESRSTTVKVGNEPGSQ